MKPTAAVVLGILQRGGWWSDYALIDASGQTQAGRRLRELRAQGYRIERRRRYGPDGKPLSTYEYRLAAEAPGGPAWPPGALTVPHPPYPPPPAAPARPAASGSVQAALPWADADLPAWYGPP